MITRRNVRDGKSSRSVEGNQICGEIGVPLELVFCEEANDRPHAEQLYFINPMVHFSPWDRRCLLSDVSGSPTTYQFILDYPAEHAYSC